MTIKQVVLIVILAIFYVGIVDTIVNEHRRKYRTDCSHREINFSSSPQRLKFDSNRDRPVNHHPTAQEQIMP